MGEVLGWRHFLRGAFFVLYLTHVPDTRRDLIFLWCVSIRAAANNKGGILYYMYAALLTRELDSLYRHVACRDDLESCE